MPRLLHPLPGLIVLSVLCGDATFASSLAGGPRAPERAPLHTVQGAEIERARRALPPDTENDPRLIAIEVPSALGLADGRWADEGGSAVWRLRLSSPEARLLIPSFSRFELPAGAELRVMTPDARVVQGPYTHRNRSRDGGLTTALVPGSEALLELRVPSALRDRVDLQLSNLAHGLRDLAGDAAVAKSGDCNIDVACPQGDGWRDQIRSVVRLQVSRLGGAFFCTGQLINNTAQDDTPYVLTANHCGINSSNDARVVVYFNYQTSACGAAPDGSVTQNQEGSVLVSSDAASDHSLIRLEEAPRAAFDVHLAGFNASPSEVPQSGRVIHHPSGDEKRISVYATAAQRSIESIDGIGTPLAVFAVRFSQGVTEPGSSGSALFNQDHQIVGVLSGGSSSCANPDGQDLFGRLDTAWSNGLSRYLDPAGSGLTSLCGTDPGTDCSADGSTTTPGDDRGGSGSGGGGGGAFGSGLILALAALCRPLSARLRGALRRRRMPTT
jgi:V8-like Glu-specific endopeptidase